MQSNNFDYFLYTLWFILLFIVVYGFILGIIDSFYGYSCYEYNNYPFNTNMVRFIISHSRLFYLFSIITYFANLFINS